jgi:hypothetical protein
MLGSGPPIKRIVFCPGDRLINEGKIVIKQFLGSRTGSDRASAIRHCHEHFCGHEGAGHIGDASGGGHRFGSCRRGGGAGSRPPLFDPYRPEHFLDDFALARIAIAAFAKDVSTASARVNDNCSRRQTSTNASARPTITRLRMWNLASLRAPVRLFSRMKIVQTGRICDPPTGGPRTPFMGDAKGRLLNGQVGGNSKC